MTTETQKPEQSETAGREASGVERLVKLRGDYMNNLITTWRQGRFIDKPKYRNWTQAEKDAADKRERHLVRPSPTDNAICYCQDPQYAEWIASRLNLAAKLEQMTYDYATGKTDGSEIVAMVRKNLEAI